MAMNRASFRKQLEEGLNTIFGMEYGERPEEWRQVFRTGTSRKAQEEDVLMYGLGSAPVRGEGAPVDYDEGGEAWSTVYYHKEIALGIKITQVAREDNLYGNLVNKYVRALARSMRHTKEIDGAAVLNNATSGSYLGGDSKSLLATDHPTAYAGDQSNKLATPADLSETALESICIQIRKAKDDRGIPIDMMPTKLIIPPDLMFVATRILRSLQRVGTADNDINAMRSMGMFQTDPVVITRMTDADRWFVETDCPDGMKYFQRVPRSTKMTMDDETDDYKYRARERYSFGWTDWRGLYGSEGAA